MKTSARALTVAFTSVVALGLAGCSGDSEEPEATPTPTASPTNEAPVTSPSASPTASDESTDEDADATPAAPAAPGDITAPGAALTFGDTALVPWKTFSSETPIQLSVTVYEPRVGALSDFDGIGLDDDTLAQIEGYTPYYIDYDMQKTNLDEGEIAHSAAYTEIGAVNAGGADIPEFSLFGTYEKCDNASFDSSVDEGEIQKSCNVFLLPAGQEFGSATWDQTDTDYSRFDGDPIAWSN